MSALPSLSGLCLMTVQGEGVAAVNVDCPRLLGDGKPEDFENRPWTDALALDAPEEAQEWLATENLKRPLHARCNKGTRWLRARACDGRAG